MWIAISTAANREMLAIDNLRRQGYETYCPVFEKKISHARAVHMVRRPLFPGYVFVSLDETAQPWRPIRSTAGVRHVVNFGERPATVPSALIDTLKAQEVGGVIPPAPLDEAMPAGAVVTVTTGIFKDMIARVLSCRAQDRVLVMLDILKRNVPVELPANCLERA